MTRLPSATGDPTDEVRGSLRRLAVASADSGGGGSAVGGVRAHGLPPRKRGFRRYVDRYEDEGLDGLLDKRLAQVSARRAPVDEAVMPGGGRRRSRTYPWIRATRSSQGQRIHTGGLPSIGASSPVRYWPYPSDAASECGV